jgi:hypothetical protein
MYQYVLAWDTTVFRGMMNLKSPSAQMLQDTFHCYIRAYLSVLFKNLLSHGVDQWVYIIGLYWVCTVYILGLYL